MDWAVDSWCRCSTHPGDIVRYRTSCNRKASRTECHEPANTTTHSRSSDQNTGTADSNACANQDGRSDRYANAHVNQGSHSDRYANAHVNQGGQSDRYTNAHVNQGGHSDQYANAIGRTDRGDRGKTYSYRCPSNPHPQSHIHRGATFHQPMAKSRPVGSGSNGNRIN
jgi:hypothetical protein